MGVKEINLAIEIFDDLVEISTYSFSTKRILREALDNNPEMIQAVRDFITRCKAEHSAA